MMQEDPKIAALDVAGIQRWIDDPDIAIAEVMAAFSFLRTEADAREFLNSIRAGLDDFREGRTVPHEQVVREAEDRRRRYRSNAAE